MYVRKQERSEGIDLGTPRVKGWIEEEEPMKAGENDWTESGY